MDIIGSVDQQIDNYKKINEMINNKLLYLYKYFFENNKNVNEMVNISLGNNKYIISKNNTCSKYDGHKKYIATANITESTINSIDSLVDFKSKPSRAKILLKKNSILFAKMKDTNKKLVCLKIDDDIINEYIFSTGFSMFEYKEETLNYFWVYINTKNFEEIKNNLASGATQQAVNDGDLDNIILRFPKNEQYLKHFNELTTPLLFKQSCLRKKLEKLNSYKEFLLPLLLNEQIS